VFNILPTDRGRPLTDLSSRMALPELERDLRRVIAKGIPVERRIERERGEANFLVRVLPYKSVEGETTGVIITFVDVTSLTEAEAHQRVLIAELNHRVKNMLSVVLAVAEQTARNAPSLDAFRAAYVPRLHAMARSFELLSRDNWTEASMQELATQALEPFDLGRIELKGPDIRLKPRAALAMGMIFHELATNAGKYGALSVDKGQLALSWDVAKADSGEIVVRWVEKDGPRVNGLTPQGFGLNLVERETEYSLGGKTNFDFTPTGLHVGIKFKRDDAGSS
jgi:two-component system CheB/CheR fusion protein